MRIEILQAGTGDCIWINHNKKNIVIDGGKSKTAIKARYAQMPQDEELDLLVVTHIDSDHIAGGIALVEMMKEKGETARLKQVWFNYPKKPESDEYSVPEGNELSSLLCSIDGLYWINNTSELIGGPIEIGGVKLHLLAPNHDVADEYKPKEPDELGVENADWGVNLQSLIDNVDDDNLDEGGPNSQSIVILAECEGKKVLLPGDCTPHELSNALCNYNSINGPLLKLDLIKLPHHGSTRNITKAIATQIDCADFVISTKLNKKYLFPNKETIAKLICYRTQKDRAINVYFNYQDALDVLGITEKEKADNNIKLTVCREFNI
ncbi:MAG: MBL fold metallo-hydrolase [Prevotella sp.]|nr:MBL fold metallo-hydrolase [Prevotella sp.]